MSIMSAVAPAQREILVNLGNRYVVFGPAAGLPRGPHFRPESDLAILPKVVDEADVAEERIIQTLQVHGMKRPAGLKPEADIELLDDDGNPIRVEIKIRERDPKDRDMHQAHERMSEALRNGQRLEVWYFNIERLKLVIMRLERLRLQVDELVPLNVWEKTADDVYERSQVIAEVDDWVRRVAALYEDVQSWLSDQAGIRCEQSRTVTLSEELMQRFAVTDRDIPVLDVLQADQVVASFVPRGLWLVGSWGRIDIITRTLTFALVAVGGEANLEWRLTAPGDRTRRPFDKAALAALLAST